VLFSTTIDWFFYVFGFWAHLIEKLRSVTIPTQNHKYREQQMLSNIEDST